jgi:hypothetical protein
MELFKANTQWMTRPDDERFWTLDEMYKAVDGYRQSAREGTAKQGDLKFIATDKGAVALKGKTGEPAMLTHWAFEQVCDRLTYPAWGLRTLSPQLAADVLNYCVKDDGNDDAEVRVLLHGAKGDSVVRAFTSDQYTRIWNADIVKRCLDLPKGWRVPPARPVRTGQAGTRKATKADVVLAGKSGLTVKVGDDIAPAGLYASDHDCFIFMVNEENRIKDGSKGPGLARGFFAWNSEVGAGAFYLMSFLYAVVCGNHIVWDASNITKIRVVHRGDKAGDKAFAGLEAQVERYAEASAAEDEKRIREARRFKLGDGKDDVLDAIFKLGIAGLSKTTIGAAYDVAELHGPDLGYGAPNTVWGMVNGITHYSQQLEEGGGPTKFAEDRAVLDRAAGKLLQVAF